MIEKQVLLLNPKGQSKRMTIKFFSVVCYFEFCRNYKVGELKSHDNIDYIVCYKGK